MASLGRMARRALLARVGGVPPRGAAASSSYAGAISPRISTSFAASSIPTRFAAPSVPTRFATPSIPTRRFCSTPPPNLELSPSERFLYNKMVALQSSREKQHQLFREENRKLGKALDRALKSLQEASSSDQQMAQSTGKLMVVVIASVVLLVLSLMVHQSRKARFPAASTPPAQASAASPTPPAQASAASPTPHRKPSASPDSVKADGETAASATPTEAARATPASSAFPGPSAATSKVEEGSPKAQGAQ